MRINNSALSTLLSSLVLNMFITFVTCSEYEMGGRTMLWKQRRHKHIRQLN
jgi:hypothetical protein